MYVCMYACANSFHSPFGTLPWECIAVCCRCSPCSGRRESPSRPPWSPRRSHGPHDSSYIHTYITITITSSWIVYGRGGWHVEAHGFAAGQTDEQPHDAQDPTAQNLVRESSLGRWVDSLLKIWIYRSMYNVSIVNNNLYATRIIHT